MLTTMEQSQGKYTIRWRTATGEQGSIPLDTQPLRVGSQNADILLNVRAVSRQHMTIALIDGHVYVTDTGSRNGVTINGFRLTSGIPQEWRSGDRLVIPDVEFELIAAPRDAAQSAVFSDMNLRAAPTEVRPGQKIRLSLSYQGAREQPVLVQAYPLKEGVRVDLGMEGGSLKPGVELVGEARARRAKLLLLGGTVIVRFTASAALENLFDTAQVTVRVRPRYELLLLLLLLGVPFLLPRLPQFSIVVAVPTTVVMTVSATASPTASATPTPSASASASVTASATHTPTATPTTATITARPPSATPSVTPCVVQPPPGWVQYTVVAGDTLRRLSGDRMDEVVRVNCILDPDLLPVGKVLWLPTLPQPDLVISASTNGSPSWDSECSALSIPVSYTVTNNGRSAASSFFNNVWVQFPDGRIAGALCGDAAGTSCQEVSLGAGQSQTLSGTLVLYNRVQLNDASSASMDVVSKRVDARVAARLPGVPFDAPRQQSDSATLYGYAQADVLGYGPAQACTNNSGCRLQESDESNNRSASFSVQIPNCSPPIADLGVLDLAVSLDCQDGRRGVAYSYSYRIYNYGNVTANSFYMSTGLTYSVNERDRRYTESSSSPSTEYLSTIRPGESVYFDESGTLSEYYPMTLMVSVSVAVAAGSPPDNDPSDNEARVSASSSAYCVVLDG
ncbi:MAG: FHA domain-containing protein [Anaerolineae bacterium]|nr:FHA domain-containing protein [Anaerolineae bacterium]